MITVEVDPDIKVAIIKPQGLVNSNDIETIIGVVEPYLDQEGRLHGVLIEARKFPGWESFRKLLPRLKFSGDEHREVLRVAVATDAELSSVEDVLAEHFAKAEVRLFRFEELKTAKQWAARE